MCFVFYRDGRYNFHQNPNTLPVLVVLLLLRLLENFTSKSLDLPTTAPTDPSTTFFTSTSAHPGSQQVSGLNVLGVIFCIPVSRLRFLFQAGPAELCDRYRYSRTP